VGILTVVIQETAQRQEVLTQALGEGGRHGHELIAVTPIVSSGFDERLLALSGSQGGWRTQTVEMILTFKRRSGVQAPATG